jgi:hypothetical protein
MDEANYPFLVLFSKNNCIQTKGNSILQGFMHEQEFETAFFIL